MEQPVFAHEYRNTLRAFLRAQIRAGLAATQDHRPSHPEVTGPPPVTDEMLRGMSLGELADVLDEYWDLFQIDAPPESRKELNRLRHLSDVTDDGPPELLGVALLAAERYAASCGSRTAANAVRGARTLLLGDLEDDAEPTAEKTPVDSRPVPIPKDLVRDRAYSREEIHGLIGGSRIKFLPHVGGRVIAGAFKIETNPFAPEAVLIPRKLSVAKWAHVVARQSAPIPVFVGEGNLRWVYKGPYRSAGISDDPDVVRKFIGDADPASVEFVLFFESA